MSRFRLVPGSIAVDAVFDAVTPPSAADSSPHVYLGAYRVTDLSAVMGSGVWLLMTVATQTGSLPLTLVEVLVSFALLVLLPLGLGQAATPRASGGPGPLYPPMVIAQFPAALAAVGSLTTPVGSWLGMSLAVPWVGVTSLMALFGGWRLLSRGVRPVSELAIDAAVLYVPVGAIALLFHRAGFSFQFTPLLILLTAVHYHYAGFVLPLVTGLVGRHLTAGGRFPPTVTGRIATVLTLLIIGNLAVIAVGITFSPMVEVLAVAAFTLAVAGFAGLVLRTVVPRLPRRARVLLTGAALTLFVTMTLAFAYGYSALPTTPILLTIGEMVQWHGILNAFGFALPSLLAFRATSTS